MNVFLFIIYIIPKRTDSSDSESQKTQKINANLIGKQKRK